MLILVIGLIQLNTKYSYFGFNYSNLKKLNIYFNTNPFFSKIIIFSR